MVKPADTRVESEPAKKDADMAIVRDILSVFFGLFTVSLAR